MPPELPRPEPNPSPRPGPIQARPGEAPFHHSPSSGRPAPESYPPEAAQPEYEDVEEEAEYVEEEADAEDKAEPAAAPEAPVHPHYSTEDDYLDDPVLEPRMALAPHMERPPAPADPVPAGYYPPGSTYPSAQRRRRRGTARKTAITEELLEAQSAVLSHEGGAHWQKTRRRRDAFIIGFVMLAVAAVMVIIFLPDKYFGVKHAPVDTTDSTDDTGERGPRRQLDPYVSSADILAERDRERAAAAAAAAEGPLDPESALLRSTEELTPEQRQAIVDRALKEAADFRAQLDQELKQLESTVDPNADLELPPDALAPPRELSEPPVTPPSAPLTDPGATRSTAPPAAVPGPVAAPSATLDPPTSRKEFRPRRKSQAEIDAEVDAQMKATMNQMIQEKKIAPPPAPVPEPVPGVPGAGTVPRAVPVEPRP